MSRLTEAVRRAGGDSAIEAPSEPTPSGDAATTFPSEIADDASEVTPLMAMPPSAVPPSAMPPSAMPPVAMPPFATPLASRSSAAISSSAVEAEVPVEHDPKRQRTLVKAASRAGSHNHEGGGRQMTEQPPNETTIREADGAPGVFSAFKAELLERLVVPNGAPPGMVEEYRKLAAALHHAQLAHGTKLIMVTSASPSEGKTLTACNLALTLSQSYQRHVLLVDADLRKPSVHEVFGVENSVGLLDALRENADDEDRNVQLVEVSSRLELLLSGGVTSDPMRLLTSSMLRALLRDAREAFDWVIIDTPPAAFLPDCNLLAASVDATLLVVRAFVTPYPLVQRVVEAVGHDKIIGVVLNQAEQTPTPGYYGYGYGYGYGYRRGIYGDSPTK
jgi:receptor protein-tyrosine kinase